jgi:hypothetical protein
LVSGSDENLQIHNRSYNLSNLASKLVKNAKLSGETFFCKTCVGFVEKKIVGILAGVLDSVTNYTVHLTHFHPFRIQTSLN